MKTINVDLSTGEALNLLIGRQGENNVTQVIFDFSALKTEFGTGTLSLSVKRPKEYVPYAQTMTVSGTNATWLVNETDTGNFGCGEIQLTYTVSGKVAKTVIYKYTVYRSIGVDGEYPIPGQTWQEEMEDEIEAIKEDLQNITTSAVPTTVRQALKTLLESAAYADTGLTDEMAVVSSWASEVTAISLNNSTISITGATTFQLVATTTPSGGTVTWSSSNTSVATVSSSGLVTGVSNGTVTIQAISGTASASCTATISGFVGVDYITAVYTQSGTVYDTDTLNSLKSDLVVTAHYTNGTTGVVTNYILSGTLTAGTSTITVSYGGKTTTFTVTVTERKIPTGYTAYDYIELSRSTNNTNPCLIVPFAMSTDYTFETAIYYPDASLFSGATPFCGTRDGMSGDKRFGFFATTTTGKLGYWCNKSDTSTNIIGLVAGEINTIKMKPVGSSTNYPNNIVIDLNGTEYNTNNSGTGIIYNEWIGFFNIAASLTQKVYSSTLGFRIFETIIKDGSNNVICDLIPCSNGTYRGFYDSVGKSFYYDSDYNSYYALGNMEES